MAETEGGEYAFLLGSIVVAEDDRPDPARDDLDDGDQDDDHKGDTEQLLIVEAALVGSNLQADPASPHEAQQR